MAEEDEILEEEDGFWSLPEFLFLRKVFVNPNARGNNLGKEIIYKTIRRFGTDSIVVLQAMPLQLLEHETYQKGAEKFPENPVFVEKNKPCCRVF